MAATDPNPQLTATIMAAKAVVEPQIRGLNDMISFPITAELRAALSERVMLLNHRDDLLNAYLTAKDATVAALQALEDDGYPALPSASLPDDLLAELRGEEANVEAAVNAFQVQASKAAVAFGPAKTKPSA
jgi:hypothetical protein